MSTPALEALEKLVDPYFSGPQFTKAAMLWIAQHAPALIERVEQYEEALWQIKQWAEAYPLDIFPEPDLKRAHQVLMDAGMSIDRISASVSRHVIDGVGKIARAALADAPERDGEKDV